MQKHFVKVLSPAGHLGVEAVKLVQLDSSSVALIYALRPQDVPVFISVPDSITHCL